MANEMIEAVARAICAKSFDGHDPDEITTHKPPPSKYQNAESLGSDESKDEYWIDDPERADEVIYAWKRWRSYADQARAAIAAMREPTEAMCGAGAEQHAGIDLKFGTDADENSAERRNAGKIYRAMIDAALSNEG